MYNNFDVNEKLLSTFNISLDEYLTLDNEIKYLLDVAYWNLVKEKIAKENEKESIKKKILTIFKRK